MLQLPNRPAWLNLAAALALGVAIVVGTVITASTIRYVKTFNESQLTVNGEATQVVTSDQVKWTGNFFVNANANSLQPGYAKMSADAAAVRSFLQSHGVKASDITISPVQMMQNFINCKLNPKACGTTSYKLQQTVTVQSGQVKQVTALADNVSPLISRGVVFSTQSLQYYYTKLASQRAKLLAEATKEARQRAQKIAGSVGAHVGQLVSVHSEPLQLTPVNSPQVSNGGMYDTSTIQKEIKAIVAVTFRLPQ